MKRRDIMNSMPELEDENKVEEFTDWMKETIDHFETKFGEINSLLDVTSIDDLDDISTAKGIAKDCADDLY